EHDPEAVQVVARGTRVHHLNRAAREAEGHGPHRPVARPVDQGVERSGDEAFFEDAFDRHALTPHSHSSAPFFHSYTKPMIRMPRKIIIDQKPKRPMSGSTTAQGNRKAISRSNRMKRIAMR